MRKLLGISLVAVLTVAPMLAMANPVAGSPTSYATQPTGSEKTAVMAGEPLYQLSQSTGNDTKVATAGYVKGAYNAAIKAVNTVADMKQDKIDDLATIRTGAGKGATAVQSVSMGSTNGTISVDGTDVAVKGLDAAAYKSVTGATNTTTYTGTGLTTQGYVDEKVASATSGMAKQTGVVETIKDATFSGSISNSSITATAAGSVSGSIVALTDWTDETKTTNASVTGSFSDATVTGTVSGTVNSTISNGSTLAYTES